MLPSSNKKEPLICPTMFQNVSKNKIVTLNRCTKASLLYGCISHRAEEKQTPAMAEVQGLREFGNHGGTRNPGLCHSLLDSLGV